VRIIPVLYHGAQAFHVFGSSPSQRAMINEVVSTKSQPSPLKDSPDWTTLVYCYAALAGAEPASQSVTSPDATRPLLQVSEEGETREMRFSIAGPEHLLQDWRIVFDRQAQVKAIFLSTKPLEQPRTLPSAKAAKEVPIKPQQ
jgi:hypothetical protein